MFSLYERIQMTIEELNNNEEGNILVISDNNEVKKIDCSVFNVGAYWSLDDKNVEYSEIENLLNNGWELEIVSAEEFENNK